MLISSLGGRKFKVYTLQMDVDVPVPKSSVHEYYVQKIEEKMLEVNEKGQNLRRLQAQRNELNAKGKLFEKAFALLLMLLDFLLFSAYVA